MLTVKLYHEIFVHCVGSVNVLTSRHETLNRRRVQTSAELRRPSNIRPQIRNSTIPHQVQTSTRTVVSSVLSSPVVTIARDRRQLRQPPYSGPNPPDLRESIKALDGRMKRIEEHTSIIRQSIETLKDLMEKQLQRSFEIKGGVYEVMYDN